MIGAKVSQHVGEVTDGGRIDHADPQFTGLTAAGSLCPVGEIAGQGDDLSGVGEHRFGGRAQRASATSDRTAVHRYGVRVRSTPASAEGDTPIRAAASAQDGSVDTATR